MNREYAIALQYVQAHYPRLFALATAVVLTPSRMFPAGQHGQCSHDNYVSINDGLSTVGEYVDTLVHELVHCKQNATHADLTDLQREEQAYEAGIQAAQRYELDAAPWRKQCR